MSLGKKLKYIRENKKYSQQDVAKHLNITRQSISKWENDVSYPDLDNLVRICKLYDISIDRLLSENDDEFFNFSTPSESTFNKKSDFLLIFIQSLLLISSFSMKYWGLFLIPFIFYINHKYCKLEKVKLVIFVVMLTVLLFDLYMLYLFIITDTSTTLEILHTTPSK